MMRKVLRSFARIGRGRKRKVVSFRDLVDKNKDIPEEQESQNEIYEEFKEKTVDDTNNVDDMKVYEQTDKTVYDEIELTEQEKVENLLNVSDFEDDLSATDIAKRKFFQEREKFANKDLIDEQYLPEEKKLVQRPVREAVWGLGGQLLKRRENFFKMDRLPTPEELQFYLELELMKDIIITDLEECGSTTYKWGITASGYSVKHVYKVAKSLCVSLNMLDIDYNNAPQVFGARDADWQLLSIRSYAMVCLFIPEARHDMQLEAKWTGWDDEVAISEYHKLQQYRKSNMAEPLRH